MSCAAVSAAGKGAERVFLPRRALPWGSQQGQPNNRTRTRPPMAATALGPSATNRATKKTAGCPAVLASWHEYSICRPVRAPPAISFFMYPHAPRSISPCVPHHPLRWSATHRPKCRRNSMLQPFSVSTKICPGRISFFRVVAKKQHFSCGAASSSGFPGTASFARPKISLDFAPAANSRANRKIRRSATAGRIFDGWTAADR